MIAGYVLLFFAASFSACNNEVEQPLKAGFALIKQYDFAEKAVGSYSTKKFELKNTGEKTLKITKIIVPSGFGCIAPDSIKAGASDSITLQFNPTEARFYKDLVKIQHNAADTLTVLNVSGSAVQLPVATTWSYELGSVSTIPNNVGADWFKYFPDGHITVVPNGENYIMFWPNGLSYRSESVSPFPEEHKKFNPSTGVIGGQYYDKYPTATWDTTKVDNGGTWLYSVFRKTGTSLLGFAHLEYHWSVHSPAYKSIATCSSTDNGRSWSKPIQILTKKGRIPATAAWSGIGDFCVIRDEKNSRWVCFYQNTYICAAMSTDPEGAPGTWFKYYQGGFTQPGIQGLESALGNLYKVTGGNPSVHFNKFLNKWIMVYHGWNGNIYISSSIDLINWDDPKLLIAPAISGGLAWYPTIIGYDSENAGEIAKIYYSDRTSSSVNERKFQVRTIRFIRNN